MELNLSQLQSFFKTGKTLDISFRIEQLKQLQLALIDHEDTLLDALYKDLGKSSFEAKVSELVLLKKELNYHIKKVRKWAKKKRVAPSLLNFPTKDYVQAYPYGAVLILSPWNYPLLLSILPLIGAISAGNCAAIKCSEFTPHTSAAIKQMISQSFEKDYIVAIEGDAEIAAQLTQLKWNKIFFTGSTATGQKVYEAAAKHLVPVTLELGGKSPCIIMEDAPIEKSIPRIYFGKFLNAGQTCVAPDYIWVHESQKEEFIQKFNDFQSKNQYKEVHIINDRHEERLKALGKGAIAHLDYPQILEANVEDAVMQEEIFGPLLPIMTYQSLEEVKDYLQNGEAPLAVYVFTGNQSKAKAFLQHFHFGAAVINDVLLHIANNILPFGGVGHSGLGQYHGKYSFECFSYKRPIVYKIGWKDLALKELPFNEKKEKLLDRMIRLLYK